MELTKQKAMEILKVLGIKFVPSRGSAIEQAQKAIEEGGFILKDDGEIYRNLTEEDLKANPELEKEGLKIGDDVGLGKLNVMTGTTITNNNKTGGKKKVVMLENVLHDGNRFEKSKEYEVDKDTFKIFTDKKFI